jgi:hypothetical protein
MSQAPDQPPSPIIPTIPPTDVLRRLAALKTAPTADLKRQWRELFGKEPPAFSRSYLQSRLAYRIQELAYGGLKPKMVARLAWISQTQASRSTKIGCHRGILVVRSIGSAA